MAVSKKKFLYINRKAPHGTIYALESLEVVLIGAAGIENAAPLSRRNAHHEIELVLFAKLAPKLLQVPVVLGRHDKPRAVIDAVVVEEDAGDPVPLFQRGLREIVGRVGRLMRVQPFVYGDCKLHFFPL